MFKQLLILIFMVLVAPLVSAHDARPLTVTLVEQSPGLYRVVVRAPPTLQVNEAPELVWPQNCDILESAPLMLALGSTSIISCEGGLENQTVGLEYPQYNPSITTLFRLESTDGNSLTTVMPPDQLNWQVPVAPDWNQVALDYTIIGMEHIWAGIDHLLFVAGLLLLARHARKIIIAITGFTIAHSITLTLATLDVVRVPVPLVETMIALSVLFLAAEVASKNKETFSHRYPVLLSFIFGLLHGFGFASVLSEVGLPTSELLTGLLFFNVGVEVGQILFIVLLLALIFVFKTVGRKTSFQLSDEQHWVRAGAYILGIPAAYWVIERSLITLSV